MGGGFEFLYWKFLNFFRICPLSVNSFFRRYFVTFCMVTPGHVLKNPLPITSSHVDFTVKKNEACRYWIVSCMFFVGVI